MKLYSFSISHFSEKARWTLDAAGIAYEEIPLVPGLHMPRTLWLSRRRSSVPILDTGRARIQDSRAINAWLAAQDASFPLLPTAAAVRADVLAIEADWTRVGEAVMQLGYARLIDDPQTLFRLWSLDADAIERPLLKAILPGLMIGFRRRFAVNAQSAARAHSTVAAALDALELRLREGRPYLVGTRLSLADITVCALLAPLATPDQHPVYGSRLFRELVAPIAADWSARPAFDGLRARYAERPLPQPGSGFAAARARLGG